MCRKSQLAIEHCYRTAELSPHTWVFWAHVSNTARLEQSFRDIADQVKIRGRRDPQTNVFELVHDWLRDTKNGRWLLVLDSADDAAVLSPRPRNNQKPQLDDGGDTSSSNSSALQQHLSRYLPSSRHGSVLVTSRSRSAAMDVVEDSNIIPIEPMYDAVAQALLRKKLGGMAEEDGSIAKLAITLDNIPLALVQAAAYIQERRCSVRNYLEEYQKSDKRKTSLLSREAGNLRRHTAYSNAVLITWQISFNQLRRRRPSAADLLSLLSFFDGQGIPKGLLCSQSGAANDNDFENDILMLLDYSFITTMDRTVFTMYRLVQLSTRNWLESQEQLDKWTERYISNLCAALPTGKYETWETYEALFPHARAALAYRPKSRESLKEWALLLYNAAWYAWQRKRAADAEQMSVVSTQVRREVLGEESEETLSSMELVALAMELSGKYEEAEAMHKQTMALRAKVLGREHPSTMTSMNNLAQVLNSQGKYEEAEMIHSKTLELRMRLLGHEHPSTLASMDNLARVLNSQGKHEEAEVIHRATLELRVRLLGREHPDTLTSMNNLAQVLDSQGKYEEAEMIHSETLELRVRLLGREHPDTLTSMNNLAQVLDSQGKASSSVLQRTNRGETADHVVGIVALAGLFNTTVECFESVQLGRAIGKSIQISQLKLDNARLRLSRWGKSLGLNDVRNPVSLQGLFGSEENVKHAEALLGRIIELFAEAEGVSNKYRSRTDSQDGSLVSYDPETDLDPVIATLHKRMRQLAIERQSQSSVRQKAKWALYEKKQFEQLIEDITELVEDLDFLFPAVQHFQRDLCDIEVSTIGEGQGMSVLREIAATQDKLLYQAIRGARLDSGTKPGFTSGLTSGFTSGRVN
jgi:tetratricopeptide (TPR) repeat protein